MMAETAQRVIDSLVQAARSGELLLFIGPGFSACCGLPTRRELIASLQNPDPDFTDLPGEFSKYAKRRGVLELASFLEHKLGKQAFNDRTIATILLETRCTAFVSTNYDCILEMAASQLRLPLRVFVEDSDLIDFYSTPALKLIKPYGTLDKKETLTLTREQYRARRASAPALYRTVAELMAHCRALLIGYGISDPELSEISHLAQDVPSDRMSQMVGVFSRAELADKRRRPILDRRPQIGAPLLELAYEDFGGSPSAGLRGFLTQLRECISPTSSPSLSKPCIIFTNGYTATLKTELSSYLANCLSVPLLATHRYGVCTADGLLRDDLRARRYEEMLLDAKSLIARNHSIVLDGTFTSSEWRNRVYKLANMYNAAPIIVKTVCNDEMYIRARLWRRKLDHSSSEHEVTSFDNFVMTRRDMMASPCEKDPGFRDSGAEVVTFRNDSHRSVTIDEPASTDAQLIAELIRVSPLMSIAV